MPDELSRLIHDFIRPNNRKTHEKKWQGVMEEYQELATRAFQAADGLSEYGVGFPKAMVITICAFNSGRVSSDDFDDEGCFDEDWTPPEDWVDEDME